MILITHDSGRCGGDPAIPLRLCMQAKIVETRHVWRKSYDHTAHPYTIGLFALHPHPVEKDTRRLQPIDGPDA